MVIANAGQMASQSLQAIQRSSPEGYRRRACSPRNRGEIGPFSNGYMIVYGALKNCSKQQYIPRIISISKKYLPALSSADSPWSHAGLWPTLNPCGRPLEGVDGASSLNFWEVEKAAL